MVQAVQQKPDSTNRDIDPNVAQSMASDPRQSVWVNASAGTGKTKVLTDRVLRLMLPGHDGEPGVDVRKILCLTFTKAGASEMLIRIQETLGHWAIMPEGDTQTKNTLCHALHALLKRDLTANDIETARALFARTLETPGGLQIMTIHSFCQSILGRFPLEAGVPPYFTPLEDNDIQSYLKQSIAKTLKKANNEKGSALFDAHQNLVGVLNEDQFQELIKSVLKERAQIYDLRERYFDAHGLYENLCNKFDLPSTVQSCEFLRKSLSENDFDIDGLRKCCSILAAAKGKNDQKNAAYLEGFLSRSPEDRADAFNEYMLAFLTQKGAPKASLANADTIKAYPDLLDILERERERVLKIKNQYQCLKSLEYTRDLFIIGMDILEHYQELKYHHAALDFDDLILKTHDLLHKDNVQWVMYKLDQGLQHILIDEAQDTNPEQWKIIQALCDEFFAGATAHEGPRSLFTVGDEKQSIYNFLRASPREFERMRQYFAEKITQSQAKFEQVSLNVSFRTNQTILDIVDQTFAPPEIRKGLGQATVEHVSFRRGQAGHVEFWPLFETPETSPREPWSPPTEIIDTETGQSALAKYIAQKIRSWLDQKLFLPSRNRSITAGDIMILFRTRTPFFEQVSLELRNENIPLSGTDRIVLSKQIAVHDLLAAAEFALLPEDDYILACLLKSPLIGMNEEDLLQICNGRPASLWLSLQKSGSKEVIEYLKCIKNSAQKSGVYEFFCNILYAACPNNICSGLSAFRSRLGNDVIDPMEEFLNKAMIFDQEECTGLQHFVHIQQSDETDIKRTQEERSDTVQIMTIHGSKGLQAPVVILPDTIKVPGGGGNKVDRRLLWPQKTGFDFPLWAPNDSAEFDVYDALKDDIKDQEEEEYRRLLYVAMTRAEDHLYIGGYTTKKKPDQKSWYYTVENAMKDHEFLQNHEDGSLCISAEATKEADRVSQDHRHDQDNQTPLPDWLFTAAREEEGQKQVIAPSHMIEQEEAESPLRTSQAYRFRRGNLTHKLLEILPNLPEKQHENAAKTYLNRFGGDISSRIKQEIAAETLKILSNREFSAIFGPKSHAEVPISAKLDDGTIINGQIDRLLVTNDGIWVIDYKTNRPPPENIADVPDIYTKQLKAYGQALRKIYPGRAMHFALLWTDGPSLMPIQIEFD